MRNRDKSRMVDWVCNLFSRIDWRLFVIGFIIVLLAAVSIAANERPGAQFYLDPSWQEPAMRRSALFAGQELTPQTDEAAPTQTPLPPELLANYQQTTGVIIFAGLVVLVVVAGVFNELIRERRTRN